MGRISKTLHGRIISALLLTTAMTQVPAKADAQQSDDGNTFEEVLVTARKREETLQNVPISMTVVTGDVLKEGNIKNLEALAALIPTLHFGEAASGTDQIFIRGVGSGVNYGFESTVGQVFDGFFMGRARFGRSAFMDVAQVEVLKGPQGALIGKNTTAGVINTRWAKPTSTFEGYITPTWEFEGDKGYMVDGAVSGPLSDTLKGRVAFRYENKQGYIKNVTLDERVMDVESPSARVTLTWEPSETMDAALVYQYNKQTRLGRIFELAKCPAILATQLAPYGEDCELNYEASDAANFNGDIRPPSSDTEAHFAGLTINWHTAIGTVTSLTGYSRYTTSDNPSTTYGGVIGNYSHAEEKYEQWSEEIRLVSDGGGALDYILGAYFQYIPTQNLDLDIDFNAQGPTPPFATTPPAGRLRSNRIAEQDSTSIAAFGEVTWNIDPKFDITAGGRFTHEKKNLDHQQFQTQLYTEIPAAPSPLPIPPVHNVHDISTSLTEDQFTPNGTIRWRPTEEMMYYASASKGYKGGGFDFLNFAPQATVLSNIQFGKETVTAFEAGGKFRFPDQRIQFNIAAFYNKFKGLQVTSLTLNQDTGTFEFRTANAGSAITKGVEADFNWRPIRNLSINATVAYLDATYDKYTDAPCYFGQTVADGCIAGPAGSVQDLSGQALQFSPNWKGSIDGRYTQLITDELNLEFFGRLIYSGKFYMQLDLDPREYQDDYVKIDASIALADSDSKWRLELIGRNLTDKLTTNFGNDDIAGSHFFAVEPPRSFAVQATVRF